MRFYEYEPENTITIHLTKKELDGIVLAYLIEELERFNDKKLDKSNVMYKSKQVKEPLPFGDITVQPEDTIFNLFIEDKDFYKLSKHFSKECPIKDL